MAANPRTLRAVGPDYELRHTLENASAELITVIAGLNRVRRKYGLGNAALAAVLQEVIVDVTAVHNRIGLAHCLNEARGRAPDE